MIKKKSKDKFNILIKVKTSPLLNIINSIIGGRRFVIKASLLLKN